MKKEMNSVNIYYEDLNRLITECVTPLMEARAAEIELWFWERGCIGGRHLKVRWVEKTPGGVGETLERGAAEFIARNPSLHRTVYSEAAIRRLIETEKREVLPEELEQKTDCVVRLPYERRANADASDELIAILHGFLHDSRPFCTALLAAKNDDALLGLRLLAVFAIEQFGGLDTGCITFRAHWDNYENWFKPSILPERIKQHYGDHRAEFHEVVRTLMKDGAAGEFEGHPIYRRWLPILRKYRAIVHRKQTEGVVFIPEPTTVEGVIATAEYLDTQDTRSRSEQFLRRLYSEPDYLGNLAVNQGLQMTRVMVNLVYHVISNLGISAFERMSYCYYLHRSVEELLGIDILDKLDEQMARVLAKDGPASREVSAAR